jgi:hypothetical protein
MSVAGDGATDQPCTDFIVSPGIFMMDSAIRAAYGRDLGENIRQFSGLWQI